MPSEAVDLYYEDIEVGRELFSAEHEITLEDVRAFGRLTRDEHPLHTDEDYCAATPFGRIIAHGLYGLALIEGLKTELRLYENTSIASLGWEQVRFRAPLFPGDRVRVRCVFQSKRETRNPERGIVVEQLQLLNQDDAVVIDAEHAAMLKRRG